MKEIGENLKEARENMGITIEEVASDLKLSVKQIENIEQGNLDAFKDIFYLKYFIRDYSKYLGLNYEDMIDEFNEYLFDYTSKISLSDIKNAKKQIEKNHKQEKRIASPYTLEKKNRLYIPRILIYIAIVVTIVVIGCCIASLFKRDDFIDNLVMQYNVKGSDNFEFTK